MTIGVPSQIAVKWQDGSWTYYRADKSRNIKQVVFSFRQYHNFRFAIVYEWLAKKGSGASAMDSSARGKELYYFDRLKFIEK